MQLFNRYGGFIAVAIEWVGFVLCLILHPINFSEPASQYGYYSDTRLVFAATLTLVSLSYYLFSRQLDRYWQWTSLCSLIAGICLTITAWVPYQPYASAYALDAHNLSVTGALILYALPMFYIGYKKVHITIARLSHIGFIAVTIMGIAAVIARTQGKRVFLLQLASAVCLHFWILAINYLTLQHHRKTQSEAATVTL